MSKKQPATGLDGASASRYWQKIERKARFTALGVAVLIAAVALTVSLSYAVSDSLAGAVYLLTTTVGVLLLVYPHLNQGKRHKHRAVLIAPDTRRLAQQQLEAYSRQRTLGMLFGIGMCVFAVIAAIMFGSIPDNTSATLFMLFVAVGVFFLIYVNMIHAGYKRLTHGHARLA